MGGGYDRLHGSGRKAQPDLRAAQGRAGRERGADQIPDGERPPRRDALSIDVSEKKKALLVYVRSTPNSKGDRGDGVRERITADMADWQMLLLPISPEPGARPLYLRYEGEGEWELKTLCFIAD